MEQYFRGASIQNWKSLNSTAIVETETNPGVGFECNICLDLVRDPVVTFCGHLYCWPCIYRWINSQPDPTSPDHHQNLAQCPVCKTEVSEKSLIPLYGRGHDNTDTSKDQVSHLIPQRPPSPRGSQLHHRRNYVLPSRLNHTTGGNYPVFGSMSHLADPMIGMFGEMMYARIFGNSETTLYTYPNSYDLAGSSSPRMRRHMVQTDKSLSRLCFFLCCCVMLCLLLF